MSKELTIHDVCEIALWLMHQTLNEDLVIAEANGKDYSERLIGYLRGVDELTRRLLVVMTEEETE